jgi:hypothetical protein
MPEAVEFHWEKRRIYRGAVILLAIGFPGVLLATMEGVDAKSLGLAWTAGFVALAAGVYSRSFKSGPVITISANGLHDRRISAESIPWVRIARMEEFDAENVSFVGLDFDDPKVALAHAKLLVRLIAPVHRLLGFPAVTINTSLLDASDNALIAAIQRFQPTLLQHSK